MQTSNGAPMNAAQLQELQKMQRLQQLQAAQYRQHLPQQQPVSQQHIMTNSGLGVGPQLHSPQFPSQTQWGSTSMEPSQQGVRSHHASHGMVNNPNLSTMMQRQSSAGVPSTSNSVSTANASQLGYWNQMQGGGGSTSMGAMDASTASGAQLAALAGINMGGGSSSGSMHSLLQQQQGGSNGGVSLPPNRQSMQMGGAQQQHQQQHMVGSSMGQVVGGSGGMMGVPNQNDVNGNNSQYIFQQQNMIADLQRQLQQQQQQQQQHGGAMVDHTVRRRSSGSASSNFLSPNQQQQLLQMQQQHRSSGTANMLQQMQSGMMAHDGGMGLPNMGQPAQRRNSGANDQLSLASFMGNSHQMNSPVMGASSSGSRQSFSMGGMLSPQQQQQGRHGTLNEHELLLQQQQLIRNSAGGSSAVMGDAQNVQQMFSMQQQQQLPQQSSAVTGMGMSNQSVGFGPLQPELPVPGNNKRSSSSKGRRRASKSSQLASAEATSLMEEAAQGANMFLDGNFAGGWQSNADLPDRRRIILNIVKVIEQMSPATDKMSQKLPHMAKRLEEHLYRSAQTKDEYLDPTTLKKRLQLIAHGLEMHRSTSTGSKKDDDPLSGIPDLSPLDTSPTEIWHPGRIPPLMGGAAGMSADHMSQQAMLGLSTGKLSSSMSEMDPSFQQLIPRDTSSQKGDADDGQKKKVIRQQQHRLLLLRHASKCKAGAACKTKFCGQMVSLWKHMKKCRDKECKTPHCLSSRCVLNHYRICKSQNKTSTCEVCGPVMKQIKVIEAETSSDPIPTQESMGFDTGSINTASDAMFDVSSDSQHMDPYQAVQLKLQQQQQLLTQYQQQQSQLLEEQRQLQLQQKNLLPHTQRQQLQQRQVLLQQLQQQFQQQQALLQQELLRQPGQTTSSTPQGQESMGQVTSQQAPQLPVSEDVPNPKKRSAPSGRKTQSSRGKVARPRGGKRLREMGSLSSNETNTSDLRKAIGGLQAMVPLDETPSLGSHVHSAGLDHPLDSTSLFQNGDGLSLEPSSSPKVLEQGEFEQNTSLVSSLSIDSIEQHLKSLRGSLHLTPRTLSNKCLPLIQELIEDEAGWIFKDAVDPVALGLPDYFEVVKNPMHLSLIEKKLENEAYQDLETFAREVRLVFENAILYNGEPSDVGIIAKGLLVRFQKDFDALVQGIKEAQLSLERDGEACSLCGCQRRLFEPTILYCNGVCGLQQIRRNATYFSDTKKQNHWCEDCYKLLGDDEQIVLDDNSEIKKNQLQSLKNDRIPEEAWVQCDDCGSWVHQICALFNGRKSKTSIAYKCPKCHVRAAHNGDVNEDSMKGAKDVPHCKMSMALEKGLQVALSAAYTERAGDLGVSVHEVEKAHGLAVRVVSNMEKKHVVREEMSRFYAKAGFPSEFVARSKCIALFQTIHGVDVILFAMYVCEYGQSCPLPNRRRVYISYLDSVQYFEPKCYRTTAYHALIVEYLRFVKERGFHTAHIWSCPPAPEDDYIFFSHPSYQKLPRDNMLRAWYQELLQKAKLQGVVLRTSTLFDEYFKSDGIDSFGNPNNDPSCLPYFDGDYIPGEIESIIRSLNQDDVKELLAYRSIPGQIGQDKIMMILGQRLSNMRENFIVVQLRSRRFVAAVERGENVSDWIADDDEENLRNKRAKINGKDSSILFPPSKDDIHRGLKIDSGGSSLIKIDSGGSSLINEKNDEAVQRQEGLSTKDVETKGKSLTEDSPSAGDTFCNDPFRRGSEGSGHFDLLNSRTAFDTDPLAVKPTLSQTSGGTHSTGRHGHDGSISNEDSFSDHPLPIGRTHSADAGFSDYGEEFGPKINEVDIQPEDVRDLNDPGYSPERVKILSKWAFDDMEPVLARHLGKTNGKVVGSTSDEDEPCDTEMFESRQQFLNYCQKNHFQFDELRRAKHSTMMILFQLHNPCNNCSSFDLCDELFQPVTSGLLAKRDARFEHDKNHTFTSVDLEAPTDLSIEERTRTIKVHLELLSHAASCHGPPKCSLNNCQRMKELLGHVSKCDAIVKNGCKVCSRLLPLISMHARSCTNPRGQCPIPFCDRIRERNERVRRQQQLMDDRRRQAQNDLYRVGCISGQEEPKPCGEVL